MNCLVGITSFKDYVSKLDYQKTSELINEVFKKLKILFLLNKGKYF